MLWLIYVKEIALNKFNDVLKGFKRKGSSRVWAKHVKVVEQFVSGCEWETFTTVNDVTPSVEGSFYRGNLITALLALAKEHIRNQMFSGKSYIFSNTHTQSVFPSTQYWLAGQSGVWPDRNVDLSLVQDDFSSKAHTFIVHCEYVISKC